MTKYIIRNRIVLAALTIWFVFTLTIFISCKNKEQPEETQQAVSTEETKHISASDKMKVWRVQDHSKVQGKIPNSVVAVL